MSKRGDMPAFPSERAGVMHAGLTIREEFAKHIMAAIVRGIEDEVLAELGDDANLIRQHRADVAAWAVGYADALLAELEKKP